MCVCVHVFFCGFPPKENGGAQEGAADPQYDLGGLQPLENMLCNLEVNEEHVSDKGRNLLNPFRMCQLFLL